MTGRTGRLRRETRRLLEEEEWRGGATGTMARNLQKIIARVGGRQKGRFPHGRRSVGEPELYFHSSDNLGLPKLFLSRFLSFCVVPLLPIELTAIRVP